MKRLAIIGAGRMACIFAENAREMNVETHCFAWSEGAIAKDYVDYFYPISIFDKEDILKKCMSLQIDGIVATTELTIAIVAYIAEKMSLNGNLTAVAELITDKFRNREVTRNITDLMHPGYLKVSSEEELLDSGMVFPIILKPTNKGGKRGISVIYDEDGLRDAFVYARNEVGKDVEFIAEEYIAEGQEYSVESLSYHGVHHIIQFTEKISSGPPHCVELGHQQPGRILPDTLDKVQRALKEAYTAIGINNGPCHTEIKIKGNDIYLIEFNARPGGDHIAYPLTQLSTGYEYIKGIIKVAFDMDPKVDETTFKGKNAGVLFVTEQTKYLKALFDCCEMYDWCYKKNQVSDKLQSLFHNDGFNTNYIMYLSEERPDFTQILSELKVHE